MVAMTNDDTLAALQQTREATAEAYGIMETLLRNDDLPAYAVDIAQAVVDKYKAAERTFRVALRERAE